MAAGDLQPAFPGVRPLIRWGCFPAVHLASPPRRARGAFNLFGQATARGLTRRVRIGPAEPVAPQPLKLGVRSRRHTETPPGSVGVASAAVLAPGWFPLASCLPALAPASRARTSPIARCWLAGPGSGRRAWI